MKLTHKMTVKSDPAKVWAYLVEDDKFKTWNPDVIEAEDLDDLGVVKGARGRILMKEGNGECEYFTKLLDVEVEKRLSLELVGKPLGKSPMFVHYKISRESDGTVLEQETDWTPAEWSLKLMTPLIKIMAKKNGDKCFRKLLEILNN